MTLKIGVHARERAFHRSFRSTRQPNNRTFQYVRERRCGSTLSRSGQHRQRVLAVLQRQRHRAAERAGTRRSRRSSRSRRGLRRRWTPAGGRLRSPPSRSFTARTLPPCRPPSFIGSASPTPALVTSCHCLPLRPGDQPGSSRNFTLGKWPVRISTIALRAVDLQAEARRLAAQRRDARRNRPSSRRPCRTWPAPRRRPAGRCLRPLRLTSLLRIGSPVLRDVAEAPLGIAAEVADQVHDVAAQHPQVLAAAARVFLAAAAILQHAAELAAADQVPHHLHPGAVARLMGDGQLHLMCSRRRRPSRRLRPACGRTASPYRCGCRARPPPPPCRDAGPATAGRWPRCPASSCRASRDSRRRPDRPSAAWWPPPGRPDRHRPPPRSSFAAVPARPCRSRVRSCLCSCDR